MCYNGHREVLVQAVLHLYISNDSSCTCVFGGVGTKLDIKLCNGFFLACNEITAGPRTPQHLIMVPFLLGIYSNEALLCISFLLNFSNAAPDHGTDKKNLCVIYI
jgi:hypothetical protein